MPKNIGGCVEYTVFEATIKIAFPNNEIKCQHCAFCRAEDELKRFWCRLKNRMIYNPFVPELPEFCPIKESEE